MFVPAFLQNVISTGEALAAAGWAEANAGNISLRLTPDEAAQISGCRESGIWLPLPFPIPVLSGEHFVFTAKGCLLRSLRDAPDRSCGVVELDRTGESYRVVWGFNGAQPTSEFLPHLQAHAMRKLRSDGMERAMIHTHPVNLIALCHRLDPDTRVLTRLLWSMHPEAICLFPGGIAHVPFAISGTDELTKLTCQAMENHSMVLWDYHGVFASGASLDHAFGMVEAAEKAASIYRASCDMGGVRRALGDEEMRTLAEHFHLPVAPGILEE